MGDAYCRSTFRTDNRRFLQMEINRHALHQKCFGLRPKRPRPPLIKPSVFFPPCFSTENREAQLRKISGIRTDRLKYSRNSEVRRTNKPPWGFFSEESGVFPL